MDIRVINPEDLTELIELRGATRQNAFSREALAALGITEASLAKLLGSTRRGWLAEADGRSVGFSIGDGSTGELWVIAVLPDYEGQGIGAALLRLVEEWLWSLKWTELWLRTSAHEGNRALGFYLKDGWIQSGVEGGHLRLIKKRETGA